jgi:MoaA/NifB/PqqE/SkfB family radical SAM enzyme
MQMDTTQKTQKIAAYVENATINGLPKDAYLQAGYSCNAQCVMCEIWKTPVLGKTETLEAIIEKLHNLGFEWVTLWGGEPLLHPDIVPLMKKAKDYGLKLQIITNGTFLEKYADSICAYVDNLVISIDSGLPEVHNEIRGKDIYGKVVEGVKKVLSYQHHPNLEIDCTILNENAPTLSSIIELAEELGGIFVDFDPAQIRGVGNNATYHIKVDVSKSMRLSSLRMKKGWKSLVRRRFCSSNHIFKEKKSKFPATPIAKIC